MVTVDDRIDNAAEIDLMLSKMKDLVVNHISQGQHGGNPVIEYKSPKELYSAIDFKLPFEGSGIEGTFDLIKSTLDYSANTWNPRFLDKLYAGTNPIGVISEILIAVCNTNTHVYSCSPVFSLMEVEVTKAVGQLLNMGESSGGIFSPGGSASNLLAMVTARNKLYPSIKTHGYIPRPFNPDAEYGKLVVFTSVHSHYSIDKAAQVLGLGTGSVIKVPVDDIGRMKVEELEKLILKSLEKRETPFFINATSGTTVLVRGGNNIVNNLYADSEKHRVSFDPIRQISRVAKKYGCWLHVDGSWGGGAVFSDKVRTETDWFDGSELADTFTLNPHKLLGVPLQCSMLLTPHNAHHLFSQSNSLKADYLFHGNPYDLGAGTIGCGRKPDAAKIFLAWKFYGQQGLGKRVDRALALAKSFTDSVRKRKNRGFLLVKDPSPFLQICFWFVPPNVQHKDLSKVTRELHKRVIQSGEFMVDHAPIDGQPDFFRLVINAPTVDLHRDLERLLDAIEDVNTKVDWNAIL